MPTTSNDDCYRLIKALSRTEKRYVKRYGSRHAHTDDHDYLQLFDILDGMDSYSDAAVREAVAGKPFARRLSAVKHYLYGQILEAMRAYHAAATNERLIPELFADADLLWEKALYHLAWERIAKAKAIASRQHEYAFWLKCLAWEKNYRLVVGTDDASPMDRHALSREQDHVLDMARNLNDYEDLATRLHLALRPSHRSTTPHLEPWLRSLPTHPLLADETAALGLPARINRHLLLSTWHLHYAHDPSGALHHAEAALAVLEQDSLFAEDRADAVMLARTRLLHAYAAAGADGRFTALADPLWDVVDAERPSNLDVKQFYRLLEAEVLLAMARQDGHRLVARRDVVVQRLTSWWERLPPDTGVALAFLTGQWLLAGGHRREAERLRRLVVSTPPHVQPDIRLALDLCLLTEACDGGDLGWVASRIRTLERGLTRRKAHVPAVRCYLAGLRRYAASMRQPVTILHAMAASLEALAETPDCTLLHQAGIPAWLSRRCGRPVRVPSPPLANLSGTGMYL